MERDAPPNSSLPSDVLPPYAWATVRGIARAGLGMTATAAGLGLVVAAAGDSVPWAVNSVRLILVFIGIVTAGLALSLRADLWQSWGLAAAAAALAVVGLPSHWDSFRLLLSVVTAVALTGVVVTQLTPRWRYIVLSAMIMFHFGGIFHATVSPQPIPWFAEQVYHRVFNPYLQFVYLRNAYHFYSPEPGPASLLCFLMKTEVGTETLPDGTSRKKYDYQWIVMPKRPADVRDPLGLTYYRRLSLTEQTARSAPDLILPETFEKQEVHKRRVLVRDRYPFQPNVPVYLQYRLPDPVISRFLLPSYSQQVILEHTPDAATAARTTLKVYRLEHQILNVNEFQRGARPYHPATYRAFFLGEFGFVPDTDDPEHKRTRLELLDPQEDMLYWMLPIVTLPNGPLPGDKDQKDYIDYFSAHALGVRPEELQQEPHRSRAFDWRQLR